MKYLFLLLLLQVGFVSAKEISKADLASTTKVSHLAGYCQALFDVLDSADKTGNTKAQKEVMKIYKRKAADLGWDMDKLSARCVAALTIHKQVISAK